MSVNQPEMDYLLSSAVILNKFLGKTVSIRVKTLCKTNLVNSRHMKRENGWLPVDVASLKNVAA